LFLQETSPNTKVYHCTLLGASSDFNFVSFWNERVFFFEYIIDIFFQVKVPWSQVLDETQKTVIILDEAQKGYNQNKHGSEFWDAVKRRQGSNPIY
jgi:transposase InsO family protein